MSVWPSAKAGKVLSALLRIGWSIKRQGAGSHRVLERPGWPDYVFAFHEGRTLPPEAVARIAKRTGLRPGDLWPVAAPVQSAAVTREGDWIEIRVVLDGKRTHAAVRLRLEVAQELARSLTEVVGEGPSAPEETR